MTGGLLPSQPTPWFARFFARYAAWTLRRNFAHVRMTADSAAAIGRAREHDGPVIAGMNHSSWWDPLVALVIAERALASGGVGRTLLSPMDRAQLETFAFMRRLGIFGIDPDRPGSLEEMVEYVTGALPGLRRPMVGITPQGRFSDVREPVRIKPGIAALTARLCESSRGGGEGVLVIAGAAEYTFWSDKKPELLLRVIEVERPAATTTAAWHRAITRAMRANQESLAETSIARDASAFVPLPGGRGGGAGRVHPVYDLMLRLRGKSGEIRARREAGEASGGTA